MAKKEDHSKYVLLIVAIVVVVGLFALFSTPPKETLVGESFLVVSGTSSGGGSLTLPDSGSGTITVVANPIPYGGGMIVTYTYVYTWNPDPVECDGTEYTLTGDASFELVGPDPQDPCSTITQSSAQDIANTGLCDTLGDAIKTYCKTEFCKQDTTVEDCAGTWRNTVPPDTCKAESSGCTGETTDGYTIMCTCTAPLEDDKTPGETGGTNLPGDYKSPTDSASSSSYSGY